MLTARDGDGRQWHYAEAEDCITCVQEDIARVIQIPSVVYENEPPENEEPLLLYRAAPHMSQVRIVEAPSSAPPASGSTTDAWLNVARGFVARSRSRGPVLPKWLSSDYRLTDYSELDRAWIDRQWRLATDNGV